MEREDLESIIGHIVVNNRGSNSKEKDEDDTNACNSNFEVQYPTEFRNSAITLRATPFYKDVIGTIIIATQCKGYDEESFKRDVEATSQFFNLNPESIIKVLLKPVANEKKVLDAKDATRQMVEVVNLLNKNRESFVKHNVKLSDDSGRRIFKIEATSVEFNPPLPYMRIICLGVAMTDFTFKALEYMLNEWHDQAKYVQFITYGDSTRTSLIFSGTITTLLQFWKDAIINNLCTEVQYVNLQDYLPFGYYDGKCKKFSSCNT